MYDGKTQYSGAFDIEPAGEYDIWEKWLLKRFAAIPQFRFFTDQNIPIIAKEVNDSLKSNITNDKEYKLAKEHLAKLNKGLY